MISGSGVDYIFPGYNGDRQIGVWDTYLAENLK